MYFLLFSTISLIGVYRNFPNTNNRISRARTVASTVGHAGNSPSKNLSVTASLVVSLSAALEEHDTAATTGVTVAATVPRVSNHFFI